MDTIYLLIPIALIFLVIALKLFFWAVKSGQFEDLEGPGHSILFDDEFDTPKENPTQKPPLNKETPERND